MGTRSVRVQWDVCGMHFLPRDEGQPATSRLPRAPRPRGAPDSPVSPLRPGGWGAWGSSPGAARGHHP